MVKKYIVVKKYICTITDSLCEIGEDNNEYGGPPPNCDECETYLTRNDPPIIEKTYTKVRITPGSRDVIGVE